MQRTTWGSLKNIYETSNQAQPDSAKMRYVQEAAFRSESEPETNKDRYFIIVKTPSDEYYCFVMIDSPVNEELQEFEASYKNNAFEMA